MKVLIVGAGRVGMRTARVLHEEGHEVVVIEQDHTKAERARDAGLEAHEGDASQDDVIEGIDLSTVDAVGALTGDLNVNFAVCTVGNHYSCRTVMRIDDDYRQEIYEKYAGEVDEVVYPERLGAAGAKTALLGGNFNVIADLAERLQMLSITITADSPAVGKRVSEVSMPAGARIYAHGMAGEPMRIPLPGTEISPGDRVAVIAEGESLSTVNELLVGPTQDGHPA